MAYEKLSNFRGIFRRDDFDFISDISKVNEVCTQIRRISSMSDAEINKALELLNAYINKLHSFCIWLNTTLPDVQQGFSIVSQALESAINFLARHEPWQRGMVPERQLSKVKKDFLSGLSVLLSGIRAAFDTDIVSSTGINEEQMRRYFLDKTEGLGARFRYNTKGRHAFAKKLGSLGKELLITAARLLIRPAGSVRTFNGWLDFGEGRSMLRILADSTGRRIYFLYVARQSSEHDSYKEQLRTPPSKVQFEPA
ncbi:hypothetical protein HYV82_01295 [Candidatus Woesearchaeota archaeon]|nr:hypothetical protein [Candidatus Woesearchaeota archaeon]